MSYQPLKRDQDRYIDFNDKFLGFEFAETQKRILRTVAENRRTLIISGNGVGKSWIVAYLLLAFVYTNEDSTGLGTSGSYSQFIDTMWRPLLSMHKELEKIGLPGEDKGGNSPRLEIDDDWFIKVVSPRDPGDIEGRHANQVLVIIEEADKKYITSEHFESAGSSVTDTTDRMVAVANPPRDESDVVYDKMQSDRWKVIQFSSFDSHNVQYDMGNEDHYIEGLVDLLLLADDWEEYNEEWPRARRVYEYVYGEAYPGISALLDKLESDKIDRSEIVQVLQPGFEYVSNAHRFRNDLDERWYRRRAGIIPPADAAVHRPFHTDDVDLAFIYNEKPVSFGDPIGFAADIARKGGDSTVVCVLYAQTAKFVEWSGADHPENERRIRQVINDLPNDRIPGAVDAIGEGSGIADNLARDFNVSRFKNSTNAINDADYDNKWTESLAMIGQRLPDMWFGDMSDDVREEFYTAARTVKYDTRAKRSGEVLVATPKADIKQRLGRSPDSFDAYAMACHAADAEPNRGSSWTW